MEGFIGEGGMGRVYRASHAVLGRKVALKVLRRDQAVDETTVRRFEQEARAAAAVGHPAIVGVEDFARTDQGDFFLVMELLEGKTLETVLDEGGALSDALSWLAEVARGLAAAHAAGVVHRDLKPGNIILAARSGDEVQPKILDFGIAKLLDAEASVQTEMGTVLGTPYYLAPERVRGGVVDPRADLYSLGVILYEVLTGTVPFLDASFMGVLARHVREAPLDPRQAAPERTIPDALANLCMALLAKDPARRPAGAAEVADTLEEILREHGPALAEVPFGTRGEVAAPDQPTQAVGAAPDEVTWRPEEHHAPWTARSDAPTVAPVDPRGEKRVVAGERMPAATREEDVGPAVTAGGSRRRRRFLLSALAAAGAAATLWAFRAHRSGASAVVGRRAVAGAHVEIPVEEPSLEGASPRSVGPRAAGGPPAPRGDSPGAERGDEAAPEGGTTPAAAGDRARPPGRGPEAGAHESAASATGSPRSRGRDGSTAPKRSTGGKRRKVRRRTQAGATKAPPGEAPSPELPPPPELKDDVYED